LRNLGLTNPLSANQIGAILSGEALFNRIGCEECHRRTLKIEKPIFSTPSQSLLYRDDVLPSGIASIGEGLDPARQVSFDLTRKLPDNIVVTERGDEIHLAAFATDDQGRAVVPSIQT
jgi:hypothetical protein